METGMQQIPVKVEDLRKSFGEQKVLDGISLDVPHGQTMAVLGRSGTGKSVLLKLLVGLQTPDRGSVRIRWEGEIGLSRDDGVERGQGKQIGFLFQQAALYDSLSRGTECRIPAETAYTAGSEEERRNKVRELLSTSWIERGEDFREDAFREISGGMQKLLSDSMARALALDPAILLLDEPTAGLDPITAEEIAQLIVELKKKREITAVVVTHDVRGAKAFADNLVLLNAGKIVAQGTFEELSKSKDKFTSRFFGGDA